MHAPLPVIDLFAGPGGLSEGFARLRVGGRPQFRVALSIEKDPPAHATLILRTFFRQFSDGRAPDAYYEYVRGEIDRDELFARHPDEAAAALDEAWLTTLGEEPRPSVRRRIDDALEGALAHEADLWVLVGGPPCQAYSLVGRSRIRGGNGDEAYEADSRHVLYREYLRILGDHAPPVFIMENVKGLLSATRNGESTFHRIYEDLQRPGCAIKGTRHEDIEYSVLPVTKSSQRRLPDGSYVGTDFIVKAETRGLPQARHRVIMMGIRSDLMDRFPDELPVLPVTECDPASVCEVLDGLPRLRSGLSRGKDSPGAWRDAVTGVSLPALDAEAHPALVGVVEALRDAQRELRIPKSGRGGQFVRSKKVTTGYRPDWYLDEHIGGVLNHESRGHIPGDLARYLFAACFAKVHGRSPALADFPTAFLPAHRNVERALRGNMFSDRFRVQLANRPSTTITSHISKDGHYFIHPDPSQCRSLTVREAARLQTFPDNYFFEGNRTQQYVQVGNAVPPLLAHGIAGVVAAVLGEPAEAELEVT